LITKNLTHLDCRSPARKTVTRTLPRKTITVTRTSATPVGTPNFSGRLFMDVNGNGRWDARIDAPIGNNAVNLVRNGDLQRRPATVVVSIAVTDASGMFYFYNATVEANETLSIALPTDPAKPLATVTIDSKGQGRASIPIALPGVSGSLDRR
jgi:hypothetical protein